MVKSPCINICKVDKQGICVGCFRTLKEISKWSTATDNEKLDILEYCMEREYGQQDESKTFDNDYKY